MPLIESMNVEMVCPYCWSQHVVSFNRGHPSTEQIVCQNAKCVKQWHRGAFRVSTAVIENIRVNQIFGTSPVAILSPSNYRYNIDCEFEAGKKLITFKSTQTLSEVPESSKSIWGPTMNKGDLVAFNFKKSRGLFNKTWAGDWEDDPAILQNLTLNHWWVIMAF